MKEKDRDIEILTKLCKVFLGLSADKKEYILGLADGIALNVEMTQKKAVTEKTV